MKAAFLLLLASRAFAGPVGAGDPHAATATGFPGAYLGSFKLALAGDERYGSRLLDALETHLQAVGVMTGRREVVDYLEQSAGGSEGVAGLRGVLGREGLDPLKAAALLLADALTRPEQFRQVVEGLEGLKPGVGRHAAKMLGGARAARGTGDKNLFAALHDAVKPRKGEEPEAYAPDGRLARLFDLKSSDGREGTVLEDSPPLEARDSGLGADGRPRAASLSPGARK